MAEFKLTIKNFQSIESLSLGISGFTVVMGPTDIGKSSIIRSLRYLLYGKRGDFFIRNEEKSCSVLLETGTDKIEWVKSRGKGQIYIINDKSYDKMSCLADVEGLIGRTLFSVDSISIGERKYLPQLHTQQEKLFGVLESEQQNYKNITSLVVEGGLEKIIKAIKDDVKSNKTSLRINLDEITTIVNQINTINDAKLLDHWSDLYSYTKSMNTMVSEKESMFSMFHKYNELSDKLKNYSLMIMKLENVVSVVSETTDKYSDMLAVGNKIIDYNQLNEDVKFNQDVVNATGGIFSSVSDVASTVGIMKATSEVSDMDDSLTQLKGLVSCLETFKFSVDSLNLDQKWFLLEDIQSEIDLLSTENSLVETSISAVEDLNTSLETVAKVIKVGLAWEYITEYTKKVSGFDTLIKEDDVKIIEYNAQVIEVQKELKSCPMCERPF